MSVAAAPEKRLAVRRTRALAELNRLFEILYDHGHLSTGVMAEKYGEGVYDGYRFVEKKAGAAERLLRSAGILP